MRYSFLALCLISLSACGGGAGGGSDNVMREPLVPIIPDAVAGPSGTANYTGQIALRFNAPVTAQPVALDGDMTLRVNFDQTDGAVSGFAEGFRQNAAPYLGTLFLSGGDIDDSNGGLDFAAQMSGSLQQGRDTYLIFGQVAGEFLGANEQAATGSVRGTARQSGRDAPLSGDFLTARQ